MKRHARQHCAPMKLREPQRTIARVLVCMNNGEPAAAMQYVSRSSRTRCLNAGRKAALEAELLDWWTATDVDTLRTHLEMDESKPQMHKAIVQARRFAVDSTLEGWVEIQNVKKGINQAPSIVMQQAVAEKRRLGLDHPANHRSALKMATEMAVSMWNTASTRYCAGAPICGPDAPEGDTWSSSNM